MVICRYFQQGRCRYGDKCRFEHPTGAVSSPGQQVNFRDSFGVTTSQQHQYKWSAGQPIQPAQQTSAEDIILGLPKEMQTWEQSGMWPFSCVALEKEMPSLPDFNDLSPEELRLQAYTAIKDGSQTAYVSHVAQLVTDYNNKRHQLKLPSAELKQKLVELLEQQRKKVLSASMTSSVFGASASLGGVSLFGKPEPSSSSASRGLFGSPPANQSTFGSPPANQSTFGSPPANQSTFGSPPANQTAFGSPPANQTAFGSPPANQGGFGTPSTNQTAFGLATTTPGLFGSGGFASADSSRSIFGGSGGGNAASSATATTPAGIFGSAGGAGSFGAGQASLGATATKTNLFGEGGANASLGQTFGGGSFASPAQTSGGQSFGSTATSPPRGLFGKPVTTQGQTPPQAVGGSLFSAAPQAECSSSTVYTPLDQLTEEEKKHFLSPVFILGKVPMKPPPVEYIMEQVR